MANGNCKHGVPLLMACPLCDGPDIVVDSRRISTGDVTKALLGELEQRMRAALILEVRWQLATHQLDSGPNAGMWESGQIRRREGDKVWIHNKTRAIAATPYEAVEQAAVKAARLAEKRLAKEEKNEHAAS